MQPFQWWPIVRMCILSRHTKVMLRTKNTYLPVSVLQQHINNSTNTDDNWSIKMTQTQILVTATFGVCCVNIETKTFFQDEVWLAHVGWKETLHSSIHPSIHLVEHILYSFCPAERGSFERMVPVSCKSAASHMLLVQWYVWQVWILCFSMPLPLIDKSFSKCLD